MNGTVETVPSQNFFSQRFSAAWLVALPGTLGHSAVIKTIKENSSKWMGPKFEWQEGFGAFSVSDSRREDVITYIHSQEEHHKKRSFEEEFIGLLKAHNVDYDPRYVFG